MSLAQLHAAFEAAYWTRFGVALAEIRPMLVNLSTAVIGKRKLVDLKAIAAAQPKASLRDAQIGVRQVWFARDETDTGRAGGFVQTPVYKREWFPAGVQFDGPAIIEQLDCTTVVDSGAKVELDGMGNLIVRL